MSVLREQKKNKAISEAGTIPNFSAKTGKFSQLCSR
jgi:hypothetical protein